MGLCGVIFIYDGEAKQAEQLDMGGDGASGTQTRINCVKEKLKPPKTKNMYLNLARRQCLQSERNAS